jgi:predicted alpha/beta superfamily hydrolase
MLPIQRTAPILLFLTTLASSAAGQATGAASWGQVVLNSNHLGKRTVYIATPRGYERGTARYPLVIFLDADRDLQFQLGMAQVAYLSDNGPAIPPVILAGIVNGADRLHDMTPPATGASASEYKTAGGANAFADFILTEVLPLIRSKYRAEPTTVLAGHSAAGLFALDVAAARPGAFQGIIAMSPALWFNDASLVVRYADAIAKSRVPLRLFVTSGGLEPDIDVPTRRFAQRLDFMKPANVAHAYHSYPNDTHSLTPLSSLPDGLRFVFEPISARSLPIYNLSPEADSAKVAQALLESEAMYAEGARSLLLPEELPERFVNRLGYALLRSPALAIRVFERNVSTYPKSVNVYASLADGYLALGDTTAAIAQLRKAAAVARTSGAPLPAETSAKLTKLLKRK